MTLDTIVRRVNYQGDDNTTCFPFPFKVWGEEQVVVYCSDPATPWTETNITQRTTVTLNADNYGGAVQFANPPVSGSNLAIVREGSFLQEDEYLSGSRFDAHEIEDRFDEDAAERQELLDATDRSIKVPNSSTQTPEEVYEELIAGAAFVNNAIATLTELYNQALYYYNLTMGYLGETSYIQSRETSFIIDKTHIIDSEGEWVYTFNDGFKYYPTTHQLLVTVDGLALTPDEHFQEIGAFGTESSQIRFKINMYQGQQVYIKAMFLGTEEFNVKLQEMDDKIEDANNDLKNAVNTAKADFENRTNELHIFVEETTNTLQAIVDGLDKEIAQTEALVQEAQRIVDGLNELNYIESKETSFIVDKTHIIDSEGEWVYTFNDGFTYHPETHQLLVTVDGLALTPDEHFQEIGESGTESSQIRFKINMYQGQQVYIKAMFLGTVEFNIKLQEMDDKIEDANSDLKNAINTAKADFEGKIAQTEALVKDLEGKIAQTESLIQEALQIVGTAQDAINELNAIYSTNKLPTQGYCELNSAYYGGSCLTLPGDVCYFKGTNTLHLTIDGLVLSPKYFEEVGGSNGANCVKISEGVCLYKNQELYAWTESFWAREGWEPEEYQLDITTRLYATSMSGCIYYSDDLGRCWRSCLRQASIAAEPEEENNLAQLPECLRGQRIVATGDTLWAFTAPQKTEDNGTDDEQEDNNQEEGGNGNDEQENGSQEENRSITGSIAAGLTGQEDAAPPAGTLVCSTDGGLTWDCYIKNSQEENSGDSNGWQTFFGNPYAFAATDGVLMLATCNGIFCCSTGGTWNSISSLGSNPPFTYVTAIAGNGQYWMIADACGQVEYTTSPVAAGAWQTGAEALAGSVNCIYGAREGFVALGSGVACTSSPRNAWKGSAEVSGTLCAGLHLPDHGLYLAVGGDTSCAYTLWSWDGLNWNCGCGVPNNAVLNNIWTSEHLPFFVDEPVTELEPMSPAAGLEDEDNGTNDGEQEDENQGEDSEENSKSGNGSSEGGEDKDDEKEEEGSGNQEENQTGSGVATTFISPAAEESPEGPDHCYFWGPISPTYRLKSDLCFDSGSIPVRITIDQAMSEGTGANNSHGNGATIAIYKSDTYQRLTREDLGIENNDSEDEELKALAASEQRSPQAWCEFAHYEANGPIDANTELYTCFTTAGQNGSGETLTASESYPTCWPAGYYAAAIYCVYGGCSLQSSIPKVNFYVSRKERYSSCAAGAEGETND